MLPVVTTEMLEQIDYMKFLQWVSTIFHLVHKPTCATNFISFRDLLHLIVLMNPEDSENRSNKHIYIGVTIILSVLTNIPLQRFFLNNEKSIRLSPETFF